MDKLKNIISPGHSKDDEVLYGSGQGSHLAKATAGEGEHQHLPGEFPETPSVQPVDEPQLSSKQSAQPFATETAHPETTSAAPTQTGEIPRQQLQASHEESTQPISTAAATGAAAEPLGQKSVVEPEAPSHASAVDPSHTSQAGPGATEPAAATAFPSSTTQDQRAPLTRDESSGYLNNSATYTARSFPLSGGSPPPDGAATLEQPAGQPAASQETAPHDGREGLAAAAGAATLGGAGMAAHEGQQARNEDSGPASKTIGPHKSNIANVLDPRVLPEPEKMKNHGARDADTEPASRTVGPHDSGAANISDPQAVPQQEEQKEKTTAGPHKSSILNKLDPRVKSDSAKTAPEEEEQHHYGRDAAVAGGAGMAAAAATHAHDKHSSAKQPADDPSYASPYSSQAIDPRVDSSAAGAPQTAPSQAAPSQVAASQATPSEVTPSQATTHKRDDSAIAGVGAGAAGAAGAAAYGAHRGDHGDRNLHEPTVSSPLAQRDQTFQDQRAMPSTQTQTGEQVKPEAIQHEKPTTIPEEKKEEDHHYGRDAAIAGGGLAAAGGAGAAYEEHKRRAEEAEAERQRKIEQQQADESARLQKEQEKKLAQEQKEHDKLIVAEQKKHDKEVAAEHKKQEKDAKAAEKAHEKEVKKAEKEHEKEVKKLEKEQSKEEEGEGKEKKGLFGFLKRDKDKDKDQDQTEEEKLAEEERHRKEAAAGAGAVGAGAAGAYAYDQHKKHEDTAAQPSTTEPSSLSQSKEPVAQPSTTASTTDPTSRRSSEGKEKKGGLLGFLHRDKDKDKDKDKHEETPKEDHSHKKEALAGAGAVGAGAAGYEAYEGHKKHDAATEPSKEAATTGGLNDPAQSASTAPVSGGDSKLQQLETTMPVQQHGVAGTGQPEQPSHTGEFGNKDTSTPAVAMYEQSAPQHSTHQEPATAAAAGVPETTAPISKREEPVGEDVHDSHHGKEAAAAGLGAAGLGAAGYEAHKKHEEPSTTTEPTSTHPTTEDAAPTHPTTADEPTDSSSAPRHRTGLGSMFRSNKEYETGAKREPAMEKHEKEVGDLGVLGTGGPHDQRKHETAQDPVAEETPHKSHHKEEAAGLGAAGAGTAAYEAHKHGEQSPDRKSSDGEGSEKKKRHSGILSKIFHRHKDDDKEATPEETSTPASATDDGLAHNGRNKLHKEPPSTWQEEHAGGSGGKHMGTDGQIGNPDTVSGAP